MGIGHVLIQAGILICLKHLFKSTVPNHLSNFFLRETTFSLHTWVIYPERSHNRTSVMETDIYSIVQEVATVSYFIKWVKTSWTYCVSMSSFPFHIVSSYIKCVTPSWTHSTVYLKAVRYTLTVKTADWYLNCLNILNKLEVIYIYIFMYISCLALRSILYIYIYIYICIYIYVYTYLY